MTPRMLMQACGDAYLRGPAPEPAPTEEPPPADPADRLAAAWADALARARAEIDAAESRGVPADRLAAGLTAALRLLGAATDAAPVKSWIQLRAARSGQAAETLVAQSADHRSLAAALRAAAAHPGARVLRERALPIPPTWKECDRLVAALGPAFVWIDREDLARLLALESFLTAARSQDLSAADGRPIPAAFAVAWAERTLDGASWPPVQAALPTPVPVAAPTPEPPRITVEPPPAPRPAPSGPALAVLARLRVASLDRLVREAKLLDASASRASVTAELRRARVRFFGDSIVALEERWP
jgi:hypothetical protein